MALAGYPKTYNSPFITEVTDDSSATEVTGVIDYVKVVSQLNTDDATVKVKIAGATTYVAHEVAAGDSLYGPFIAVEIPASSFTEGTAGDVSVLIYKRSNQS